MLSSGVISVISHAADVASVPGRTSQLVHAVVLGLPPPADTVVRVVASCESSRRCTSSVTLLVQGGAIPMPVKGVACSDNLWFVTRFGESGSSIHLARGDTLQAHMTIISHSQNSMQFACPAPHHIWSESQYLETLEAQCPHSPDQQIYYIFECFGCSL
jgi:hypothetical protein